MGSFESLKMSLKRSLYWCDTLCFSCFELLMNSCESLISGAVAYLFFLRFSVSATYFPSVAILLIKILLFLSGSIFAYFSLNCIKHCTDWTKLFCLNFYKPALFVDKIRWPISESLSFSELLLDAITYLIFMFWELKTVLFIASFLYFVSYSLLFLNYDSSVGILCGFIAIVLSNDLFETIGVGVSFF